MKEFRPNYWLNLPRWLETILQCGTFILILWFIKLLKIDEYIFDTSISINVKWLVIYILIYFAYKILGTYTAVDLISVDYDQRNVIIHYWLFYIFKRKLNIKFEELSFKNRNDIFLFLGGSLALLLYKNGKLKIKLNKRNGWKDQQIDMLTEDLLAIKQPLRTLRKRRSIYD